MEEIAKTIEVAANFVTLLSPAVKVMGAAGLTGIAIGCVPRVGPGRAFGLFVKPFFDTLPVVSKRGNIISALRQNVRRPMVGTYIVVLGDKGVGKSCTVDTALYRMPGVVCVKVPPGTPEKEIVADVSAEIARMTLKGVDPVASAKRVINFYKWMTLGRRPIAVLRASEWTAGKPYADLTGAVRTLTEMGLTAIIDASPNAVPPDLLTSKRQLVFKVDRMQDDLVISEFADVFSSVEAIGLKHVVLALVGGMPATAVRFNELLMGAGSLVPVEEVLKRFVEEELAGLSGHSGPIIQYRLAKRDPSMSRLLDEFRKGKEVPFSKLEEYGVELSSPDKMFRIVTKGKETVLAPATPAIGIVMQYGLTELPTLDELSVLLTK